MNIVGIGGGTGLPVLLRGLKQLREWDADGCKDDRVCAAAVVCVSDNGGSSGSLRRAFGIPAVGDLRNCLVALSGGSPVLRDLFQYRLSGDFGLDGHPLGNLIVAALSAQSGNIRHAVHLASGFLDLQGRVLPCTEVSASLCAEFHNGAVVRGETQIAARREPIRRVWLEPAGVPPTPGVLETILSADAIVLGPGSLHTSVIPNLLPSGVAAAVRDSPALKILVCNLMTQRGETERYAASDHLKALQDYLGPRGIQICLLNSRTLPDAALARYAAAGAEPVLLDETEIERHGAAAIGIDLLAGDTADIRHDSVKLARWIVALTRAFQRARDLKFGEVRCFAAGALAGECGPENLPAISGLR